MKVIIKKTNEIKKVSFGYAVNYLIPKGLAIAATAKNLKIAEEKKQAENKEFKFKERKAEALAKKLAGRKIVLKVKTGRAKKQVAKKLFGSITKKDILKALAIDSKIVKVLLKEPIKKLGKYETKLKIGAKIVKIIVEVKNEN